jgi:FMN-dependent NADH-azoreductase
MTTILRLSSSVFSGAGNSSQLADTFIENLRHSHPDSHVIERDLVQAPLPHLDGTRVGALFSAPENRTAEQQAVIDESDALIAELKSADIVVLGLPMYNFGIPSQLKAYFDHLARAGVTFRYTATGPVGLLEDRKVYVLATRGGYYQGTPADSQTPYVTAFLNFIGLRDIEFIYAEGLNINADIKAKALAQATAEIERHAAQTAIAA